MALPIRTRLVLGLAAIILIAAGGAVHLLGAIRAVGAATEEVRRGGEAVRDGLTLASSIREQYAHEAHLLLLPDAEEHVEHYESATKSTRNFLVRLRERTQSKDDQALVRRIGNEVERYAKLFEEELLPAFRAGDRAQALEIHERSEELVEGIVRLNDELSARFLARIDASEHHAGQLIGRAMKAGAIVLAIAIAFAAAIATYLVRSIDRPIRSLIAGTEAVAEGDVDCKIAMDGAHEFAALARSFNEMTSRLRANQSALLTAEKAASLGNLAAGVAHQLNNPLGVIVGYAGVLSDSRYSEKARDKAITGIRREAEECRTIVANLMALARPGSIELEAVDARALVERVLAKARRYANLAKIHIERRLPAAGAIVETDGRKLEQALLNLVINAVEAMEGEGTLEVAVRRTDESVALEVADTGPGIDPEIAKRLFDPYFTTKPAGTGLGLALAHGLVRALGGGIEVETVAGQGTRFRITMPRSNDRAPPRPERRLARTSP